MAEQQYRVIADRDKGDDPREDAILVGDRYTFESVSNEWVGGDSDPLVRIERSVPAEHCLSTAHHGGHEWGGYDGQAATGYWCEGFDASDEAPYPPTREQIAEAIAAELRTGNETAHSVQATRRVQQLTDAVLALIQNGADRG